MRRNIILSSALALLLAAGGLVAKEGAKPTGPVFGVPTGLTPPSGKPEAQKYMIYMLRDGEGMFSLQPVMVRLQKEYAQQLNDKNAETLKTWTDAANDWKKDPANKGKRYDVPQPKATTVASELGPFSLADAEKKLAALKSEVDKQNEKTTKEQAEKKAREDAAREKHEKAVDEPKDKQDKVRDLLGK